MTTTQAKTLAFIHATQTGKLRQVARAGLSLDRPFLGVDYYGPLMARRVARLIKAGLIKPKNGAYIITPAGIKALFVDRSLLRAQLELAQLHQSYGRRYLRRYDPRGDDRQISNLAAMLEPPKRPPKPKTKKPATKKPPPPPPPQRQPLTAKQTAWLRWLFRGDKRMTGR